MRYCLVLIVGIIIGVVSREKYGVPDAVVTCPDIRIPQCPAAPSCPEINPSNSNLDTCLNQIAGLMQQNARILDDKEGLSSSLARCNSEIDFLQGHVNESTPDEPVMFDFNLEAPADE